MRCCLVPTLLLIYVKGQIDPTCVDKLPDCNMYEDGSCTGIYEPWARDNCNNTCKYCIGPTTTPPPCRDMIPYCSSYDITSTCTDSQYKHWVERNCRRYCRKCTPEQLGILDGSIPTAVPCRDKVPDCDRKGKDACTEPSQLLWATTTCKKYCGLCGGGS